MSFDSVFQGPPSDVAAPGTKQSPSLGVDVTNKELYISAGSGWEELSTPGGAIGGTNGELQYNNSGVLGGAGLTDGSHFALGVGAVIDHNPNDGDASIVVEVAEVYTGAQSNFGMDVYKQWVPASDPGDGGVVTASGASAYLNADNQPNGTLQLFGFGSYVENDSTVRDVDLISGGSFNADHNGGAACTHLFGLQALASMDGAGSVSNDQIGVLSSVLAHHGTVSTMYSFYADPPQVTNDAQVSVVTGLFIPGPIHSSSHPITTLYGININIADGAATNTWSIKSDGTAPSSFAGPVAVPTLRAKTVYSVAGTALPSAVTEGVGARAFVSDAVANTFNTAYVGSGTNKVPVFSDGSVWRIG